MPAPKITEKTDGYLLEWTDQHIKISTSRIHIHKDGRVTGELIITTDNKKLSPILMPSTQLNFSAERTRTSLIKNLSEKYQQFEWNTIIDQLAHYIQELVRKGEPVKELWTSADVKSPEYLLEPFIYKRLPNVIYGEKAVNKSTTLLVFYTCLILPWTDNPLELKVPDRSIKSLILDWEADEDIVQYQAKALQTAMNLPPFAVNYRRCALPLADDLEQIQGHINSIGAEAIFIDSLGAAAGGDLKAPEIALNFFTALRRLKTSSLIIAQTSKDETTKRKRMFGTVFFEYYARNIWELCKSESISDNEYDIALFHRSPNLSAVLKPIAFHLHYNETGLSIERTSVDIKEFKTRMSSTVKVLDALKKGALSPEEISDRTDLPVNTIRVCLSRLKKKEKVVDLERGKWGLRADELL